LSERQVQLSTAKFVDATFKLAGWRFLDVGMKELAANAALQKYGRLAKTESGRAALQRSYGDYFGKDFPQLVEDLVGGKKTRLTMELAIREVSDAQPLSKVEMPKYYNDYPDARVLYMLKSFSIKQLNLVRDRGWKEIARGNVKQGTEFLLRYTLLAGLAGMTTDNLINALLGRDTDWDATEIPVHAMKNFGWSQYALDRLKAGRTGEALLAVGAPPIDPFVQVATGNPKAMQYVPLIGKPTYNLGMGGADKANYLKRQREARKERDEADPEAAILRRKRAKEAFEKRVRESAEAQRP
jgi:hypothetical protein